MVDDANDSPAGVEMFGCLQLIKSTTNGSGYKDVYHRKHLKKKPFQAMIYRESHKDHINLGTFEKAKEAAVANRRQLYYSVIVDGGRRLRRVSCSSAEVPDK